MSYFRSTELKSFNLILPREAAWVFLNTLGYHKYCHFEDLQESHPLSSRPFSNYIKRSDDILYKIHFIEQTIQSQNLGTVKASNQVFEFFQNMKEEHQYFDVLEQYINEKHEFITEQTKNLDNLQSRKEYLAEYLSILQLVKDKLKFQFKEFEQELRFNVIIGIIEKTQESQLQKIVFRVAKGNALVEIKHIENHPECQHKSVFTIVFSGATNSQIANKLNRVVANYSNKKFDLPQSMSEYDLKLTETQNQLQETLNLINLTRTQLQTYIDQLLEMHESQCSYIEFIKSYTQKERQLYLFMNMMKLQNSVLIGRVWIATSLYSQVQTMLQEVHQLNQNLPSAQLQPVFSNSTPPTHFNVNEFTEVFQLIVNTYGIPRYREVNPAIFTVMTFPFLFAVMFADIGHGFLLFLLGIYLVSFSDKIKKGPDSTFKQLISARYIIFFMGFFAVYCGLLYNEFASLPLNLFSSCYNPGDDIQNSTIQKTLNCTYNFGIDPIWANATNQLTFVNSFKMKLSVIIGVLHMLFGIFMRGANSLHFKQPLDFIFEFVPMVIFMICTFGYMDFMIILKWFKSWPIPSQSPSIITVLIDMALKPGQIEYPLFNESTQNTIQELFLLIAFLMIPIMLLPKPLILANKINKAKRFQSQLSENQEPLLSSKVFNNNDEHQFLKDLHTENVNNNSFLQPHQHNNHQHEDISEIFVHQVIETIEFVLGSISNTASYLRLWALSLAHGQLSEVFFKMALSSFINSAFIPGQVFAFVIFALVTFGVLMLMDVMECFLHALRLHWVEFQNKFYKGDGLEFKPFQYKLE